MIFTLGQRAITLLLKAYFKEIRVQGAALQEDGPLLVAGNHPNMALDPLLILSIYRRPLYFLGKSTLFRTRPASWFLRACHLIPVYRRSDGFSSDANDKTFEEVAQLLHQKRAISIFPEGTSIGGRTVLKLKTGTARMAFLAEERSGWSLGVKIQPIGITYAHFLGWNSGVAITVGEPLLVASLRELYERDPARAVHRVTELIETSLKNLTVHVEQANLAPLINAIHQLFTRSGRITEVDTEALGKIAQAVSALAPVYPERASDFLKRARILLSLPHSGELPRWFLSSLPLVMLGIAIHYVPYEVTYQAAHALSPDEEQLGMYTFFVGTVTFLSWYGLLFLALIAFGAGLWTPLLLLMGVGVGLFAGRTLPLWRLFLLGLALPSSVRALALLQDELIDELLEYAEQVDDPGPSESSNGHDKLIH